MVADGGQAQVRAVKPSDPPRVVIHHRVINIKYLHGNFTYVYKISAHLSYSKWIFKISI